MACSPESFPFLATSFASFAAGAIQKLTSAPYIPWTSHAYRGANRGRAGAFRGPRDGRLWFATIRGFCWRSNPSPPGQREHPAPGWVVNSRIRSFNGHSEQPSRIGQVATRGNTLIHATGPGVLLAAPSTAVFRYSAGRDTGPGIWIDAGKPARAFLYHLPARHVPGFE